MKNAKKKNATMEKKNRKNDAKKKNTKKKNTKKKNTAESMEGGGKRVVAEATMNKEGGTASVSFFLSSLSFFFVSRL